jgi:MoxR-like ATPase
MPERPTPVFRHRDNYTQGLEQVFSLLQAPGETQAAVASALLVRNGIILLSGSYGTGKTQLVNLIKKTFFCDDNGGYDFDYETCHQDLTAFDVLYHLDLAELGRGREVVHPKNFVLARLKFLNEIQRANPSLYNALLPLLSERTITYRDMVFSSPNFVLLMDQNPHDEASSEIPRAFYDRIDFIINLAAIELDDSRRLFHSRRQKDGIEWDTLENIAPKGVMKASEMEEIWKDVILVGIGEKEFLKAYFLLRSFSVCHKTDRSTTGKGYVLDCESCKYKAEVCRHVIQVPGQRALNSILKLSQARAWLAGRDRIVFDDLRFALPYSMAHRLIIKREELVAFENGFEWLKKRALDEILQNKFESWDEAADRFLRGQPGKTKSAAKEDLVLRELLDHRPQED